MQKGKPKFTALRERAAKAEQQRDELLRVIREEIQHVPGARRIGDSPYHRLMAVITKIEGENNDREA
jgi:hypothetical protein